VNFIGVNRGSKLKIKFGDIRRRVNQNMKSNVSRALNGISGIFLINLFQKLCSFVLNNLLVRYTDPSTFGLAAIQLELLCSCFLFLSRYLI